MEEEYNCGLDMEALHKAVENDLEAFEGSLF